MKTFKIVLFVLAIVGIILISTQRIWLPKNSQGVKESEILPAVANNNPTENKDEAPSIVIDNSLKESNKNYDIEYPKISGKSKLAIKAQEDMDSIIPDFKRQADVVVPLGGSPKFQLYLSAEYFKGEKSESIIFSDSSCTGGAGCSHGGWILTASLTTGDILTLADIVKKDRQNDFLNIIKNELKAVGKYNNQYIDEFAFDRLKNIWIIKGQDLVLYFPEYAIASGSQGQIEFHIPLTKFGDMLSL